MQPADASLTSPLLAINESPSSASECTSPAATTIILKIVSPVGSETTLFGEYVSRAKARANNQLRVGPVSFTAVMLSLIMFLGVGRYWCYDIPGSIQTQLTAWYGSGYGDTQNSLFYSVYSWPNVILAFFGGFILDKITGVRRGAMLFCGLVTLGQLVFSLGCQWKVY
jgi:hypothetical protein